MKRTRQILAVTLVATALCADRVVASAPVIRPEVTETARQIVRRLAVSFRQDVPSVRFERSTDPSLPVAAGQPCIVALDTPLHTREGTPFQFRLPPPQV